MGIVPGGGYEGAKASKVAKVPTVFEGAPSRKGEVCHTGRCFPTAGGSEKGTKEPRRTLLSWDEGVSDG